MVNNLCALARSRKRRRRNQRSLECACRSPGGQCEFFDTVEAVTSRQGRSTEVVFQDLAGGVGESLIEAVYQLGVGEQV